MIEIDAKTLARMGEQLACNYLQSKGYELVCKNFRIKNGEIDLIMRHHNLLAFIEVKTRRFHSIDAALQSVNYTKRKRISKTAIEYINRNPDFGKLQTRFDIILLFYNSKHNSFSIKYFPDAFYPVFD